MYVHNIHQKLYVPFTPTSDDRGDDGGQEAPSIDAQVEHREEGSPLSVLQAEMNQGQLASYCVCGLDTVQ